MTWRLTVFLFSICAAFVIPVVALGAPHIPYRQLKEGDLIRGTKILPVYYFGADRKRYAFPLGKTFFSWYDDYKQVTVIPDTQLANIPLGGQVTYRPGKRLLKVVGQPRVFAVDQNGVLRWITTEKLAEALYGDDWRKKIDVISTSLETTYRKGKAIRKLTDYDTNKLVSYVTTISQDKRLKSLAINDLSNRPATPTLIQTPAPTVPVIPHPIPPTTTLIVPIQPTPYTYPTTHNYNWEYIGTNPTPIFTTWSASAAQTQTITNPNIPVTHSTPSQIFMITVRATIIPSDEERDNHYLQRN